MATIAEEQAANARARAEGYESAAHKEAHANALASSAGYANAVQRELDANRRAQAAGFANAAEQEMDANRRSIEAGFTSAVDQEIDANRRAREAGFLNAADLETYGAAGATRSTDPFVDPRTLPPPVIPEQFALGTANLLKYNPDQPNLPGYDPNWRDNYPGGFDFHGNPITGGGILGGPPNPTVPSFGYPGYQDWSRFMPTNFGLAEGGGVHYQPWLQGGSQVMNAIQGAGGNFVARPDPVFGTGGGTATGGPGPINPNIWGNTDTTTGGNVTTDTSGNRWVMSPGGQWVPADSDYGQGLTGDARLFDPNFYDTSGNFIGSAGAGVRSDQLYDSSGKAVGWGGGKFTAQEIASGVADSQAPVYDQWGNVVDMGSRQVGLNLLGQTMFKDNYKSAVNTLPSIASIQPAIGPLNTSQSFQKFHSPHMKSWAGDWGYVDPATEYGESFGGTYEGPDTDIDPATGAGSGLWT